MEWYLEYEVIHNRPGVLGGISNLTGLLGINILMINGIDGGKRGLLLECAVPESIEVLRTVLTGIDCIRLTAYRTPSFIDRISLKHGKGITQEPNSPRTFSFVREDLGMLVDFLGELILKGSPLIGLRGMPRVGKTEATIAACVYANKKWVVISSTLMRQIMRKVLTDEELAADCVYLIDGIVSCVRGGHDHKDLVQKIVDFPVPKVIEHPDVFLRENSLSEGFFDYIVELRRTKDEVIDHNLIAESFSSFDIS